MRRIDWLNDQTENFSKPSLVFSSQVVSMIRYSSYGATNYRAPSAQTYPDPLEAGYRELLELRKRVRRAEAAVAQDMRQRRGRR